MVYNALTGAFVKLENDEYEKYTAVKFSNTETDKKLLKNLKKGGFILSEDFDELALVEDRYNKIKDDNRVLHIVISPTMKCNLACIYCYQDRDRFNKYPFMSQEVQNRLTAFVENLIVDNSEDVKILNVIWYGGEPLLAFPILNDLSENFMNICKEFEVEYSADMVTNGTLISPRMAERLSHLRLRKFQITLDGDAETHDKKRIYRNGKGTFTQILRALKILASYDDFGISLRINVDETAKRAIDKLLDILERQKLKNHLSPYFSRLTEYRHSSHIWKCYIHNFREYSDIEQYLYEKIVERGFRLENYPFPRYLPCDAVRKYSNISVDPEGFIYKCFNEIGFKERAVGHVNSGFSEDVQKWLSYSPFQFDDCIICKFLPICMGGCPLLAMKGKKECTPLRYNFEKLLQLFYKRKDDLKLLKECSVVMGGESS